MAASPPYKNVVKNGKFYHVYNKGGKKVFRFVRKAGGTPNAGQPDAQNPLGSALLDAIGLSSQDNPQLFEAAKNLVGLKLDPQIQAVDREIGKSAGAQQYLSQRMAKYQQMFQGAVNQTAQQAQAANVAPQLQQSSGNAALDQALQNSIASRSQGYAANAATAAQVAPMRFADQQQQLAQQFQSQLNDLQAKRLGIEQQRGPETLGALMDLGQQQQQNAQKQQEAEMAAQALGLDTAKFQETQRHNQAGEQNTHFATVSANQRAENSLTSAEQQQLRSLRSKEREGALNRAQKQRLAELKARSKGKKTSFLPQSEQNTVASKISSLKNLANKAKNEKKWNRHQAARAILKDNPGIDETYLSVALDLAYDGHVSRMNARRLHDRGVRVKGVGPSYASYSRGARNSAAARTGGN